jgi:hypothetical protein
MIAEHLKRAVTVAFILTIPSVSAAATYTTVSLPTLNSDLTTWTNGYQYANAGLFPSSQTFAGVPFNLQQDSATGYNIYEVPYGNSNLPISTSVYGATNVYTLINTAWGSSGSTVGSITFIGSAGATFTVNFVEGLNVRDHYYNPNPFVNTLTDTDTTTTDDTYVYQAVFGQNTSGNAHLDMQDFVLPSNFSTQTLTEIEFSGINSGYPQGDPFIAGLTVESGPNSSVPEPATMALFGVGLVGLAGFVRRKRS